MAVERIIFTGNTGDRRVLFGSAWQGAMAEAIGAPRQSVSYYLKSGGVNGAQAAAFIGLVARMAARERRTATDQEIAYGTRQADPSTLLHRFDLT